MQKCLQKFGTDVTGFITADVAQLCKVICNAFRNVNIDSPCSMCILIFVSGPFKRKLIWPSGTRPLLSVDFYFDSHFSLTLCV